MGTDGNGVIDTAEFFDDVGFWLCLFTGFNLFMAEITFDEVGFWLLATSCFTSFCLIDCCVLENTLIGVVCLELLGDI